MYIGMVVFINVRAMFQVYIREKDAHMYYSNYVYIEINLLLTDKRDVYV